jgi:hypothetical protein
MCATRSLRCILLNLFAQKVTRRCSDTTALQLCFKIDTIKKNTETLIDGSKEVGLEINVEKIKYKLLSRHQNVGKNRDIRIANRSFENVSHFKYLGTTVTNQISIKEEIKVRLNPDNACYYSVQNLLSSRLLSKILKIRICITYLLHIQEYKFAFDFVWV